jgi:type IV pilus assembly protein PilC
MAKIKGGKRTRAKIADEGVKVPWYKKEINISKVKTVEIVMMSKHLSVMLGSGLTVPEALEVLVDQTQGKLRKVLKRVYRRVAGGSSFGASLALEPKVFTPIFVSAVVVGESSGTLDENLERLSEQMDRDLNLKRNIQSALLYPAVVLSAAGIMGLLVATFVLPQISQIFRSLRAELPLPTRILLWFADFFDEYGTIVGPLVIGFVIFFIWFIKRPVVKPIVDRIVLRIPAVDEFVHTMNRARFCRTTGTLLQSGTPIEEVLDITGSVMGNHLYAVSVKRMKKDVASGESFSEIVARYPDLYPIMIQRMIAVGEKSASLGKTLNFLADYYEERVLVMSKNMSTLLEPILLVFIGLIVGLMAISILTPIYSILTAF